MAVYFIENPRASAIKIGVADDPYRRVKGLQTGSPDPLRVLGVINGDRHTEAELHQRFAAYRISGEWFQSNEDIVGMARSEAPCQIVTGRDEQFPLWTQPAVLVEMCGAPHQFSVRPYIKFIWELSLAPRRPDGKLYAISCCVRWPRDLRRGSRLRAIFEQSLCLSLVTDDRYGLSVLLGVKSLLNVARDEYGRLTILSICPPVAGSRFPRSTWEPRHWCPANGPFEDRGIEPHHAYFAWQEACNDDE